MLYSLLLVSTVQQCESAVSIQELKLYDNQGFCLFCSQLFPSALNSARYIADIETFVNQ